MSIQPHSNQLTLFAEVSLVSRSRSQESAKAPPTTDGSGPNTSVSFAALSPDGSWLKTSRDSYQWTLDGSLQVYSETWPKAGTMRTGTVYQQRPLAPHTSDTGSSLWPTPTVGGSETSYQQEHTVGTRHAMNLHRAVKLWPTPRTSDGNGAGKHGTGGLDLRTAVLYPTPRANKGYGPTLEQAVMYPTPTVQDAKNNGGPSQSLRNTPPLNAVVGGKLNPNFVEYLMGFPQNWTQIE